MHRMRLTSACLVGFAFLALSGLSLPSIAQSNSLSIGATPSAGPAPLTVAFEAFFQGVDYNTTYDWDFGDGSGHVSALTISHTYLQTGIYPVVLTARDMTSGYFWTAYATIEVWDPVGATAEQAPPGGPAPLTVNFSGRGSGGKLPYRFKWDFGDETPPSEEQNPVHTYTTSGEFHPTLQVLDSTGAGASDRRLVNAVTPAGPLQGRVGIASEGAFFLLDGREITNATVTARDAVTGGSTQVPVNGGIYAFSSLPPGTYDLKADITYTDHIPYDADLLAFGCPAPSGGTVLKQVISKAVRVTVSSGIPVAADVTFPPPFVFLHGALDCYQKWYAPGSDPALMALWDNDARMNGFLSFTPNYQWWVTRATWPGRAEEVYDELGQDLGGLTGSSPPVVMVAHDMGGLVARALTAGVHNGAPLVEQIRRIYLIGTPNSGSDLLLGGGPANLMSPAEIIRRFNQVYPDFGGTEVYAIGGSKGLWGQSGFDGRVNLHSAFAISQQTCSATAFGFPVCETYPVQIFNSGEGHIFSYSHYELGSSPSTADILENTLFPWVSGLSLARAPYPALQPEDPKSPAGGGIWGSNNRTVGSTSQSVPPGLAAEGTPLDVALQISNTDGMLMYALVTEGSADFQVLGPSGQVMAAQKPSRAESGDPGYSYHVLNPEPGTYTLRVTPGAQGATFSATAAEDSPFGITGYLPQDVAGPDAPVLLRADFDGLTPDVQPSSVEGNLYDSSGALLTSVPLYDDGQHQDGLPGDGLYGGQTLAPSSPGAYAVLFRAAGTYRGAPFKRTDLARLYVVSPAHLFTGAFSNIPEDLDEDGYYDSLAFHAGLNLQSGARVMVSGDLYDSAGAFISHAAAQAKGAGQGNDAAALIFSLSDVHCSQFGAPFGVVGLIASDGFNLVPLDIWGPPVPTAAYQAAAFECLSGRPKPALKAVRPDQGVAGQTLALLLAGHRFKPQASVAGDGSLVFTGTKWLSESLLYTLVTIPPGAAPGPRTLTIFNGDGTSDALPEAFTVSAEDPPHVALIAPADGSAISGLVPVTAQASDDIRVRSVTFLLDGALRDTESVFPFTWEFDAATVASGPHTLTARATDDAGLTSEASVTVYKDPPEITGISKLGNPFRLKIAGGNFLAGAAVFFGSDASPWSNTVVRTSSLILVRGGSALKAKFPKGTPVAVRVRNPDGAEATGSYTRP